MELKYIDRAKYDVRILKIQLASARPTYFDYILVQKPDHPLKDLYFKMRNNLW